jgi:hypothetical protein
MATILSKLFRAQPNLSTLVSTSAQNEITSHQITPDRFSFLADSVNIKIDMDSRVRVCVRASRYFLNSDILSTPSLYSNYHFKLSDTMRFKPVVRDPLGSMHRHSYIRTHEGAVRLTTRTTATPSSAENTHSTRTRSAGKHEIPRAPHVM